MPTSYIVDHRCSLGPVLLWLWHRQVTAALIRPGTPICHRCSHRKKKKKKKLKKKKKFTMRYHLYQTEWPSSKSLKTISAGEGVEKREPIYTVSGNVSLPECKPTTAENGMEVS